MSDTYKDNEKELRGLQQRVDELNLEMNGYTNTIQERSEYYRACTS